MLSAYVVYTVNIISSIESAVICKEHGGRCAKLLSKTVNPTTLYKMYRETKREGNKTTMTLHEAKAELDTCFTSVCTLTDTLCSASLTFHFPSAKRGIRVY